MSTQHPHNPNVTQFHSIHSTKISNCDKGNIGISNIIIYFPRDLTSRLRVQFYDITFFFFFSSFFKILLLLMWVVVTKNCYIIF